MQRLALCSATQDYFQFSILCSVIVGTGEVRPADILGSEFPNFSSQNVDMNQIQLYATICCEINFYLFKTMRNLREIEIYLL